LEVDEDEKRDKKEQQSIRVGLLGKHMKAHKTKNMFQMIGAVCYQHKNTLAIDNISKLPELFHSMMKRTPPNPVGELVNTRKTWQRISPVPRCNVS